MLYKKCANCNKTIDYNLIYCSKCKKIKDKEQKEKYREYKFNRVDKKEQRFYSTKAWLNMSEVIKKYYLGCCVMCMLKDNIAIDSNYTHHIVEIKDDWNKRLDKNNLISLCSSCHKKVHEKYNKNDKLEMQKELESLKKDFEKKFL